jgi:predicted nucleotidyltransferase
MIHEQRIIPGQLLELIADQVGHDVPPGLSTLVEAACERHGDSVCAVLFYGSCLRSGNVHDGLADLYLLVDDYREAFKGKTLALLNRLLPPNVFYLEVPFQGQVLRAKYAILSLSDFSKGTQSWFHSYLWGRFSQQCGLIHVRSEQVARQVHLGLASAVITFISRTLPQMEGAFNARDLWSKGLSLSYKSELRTEKPDGASRLFDIDPDYYQKLTSAAMAATPFTVSVDHATTPVRYQAQIPPQKRRLSAIGWRIRAVQGKVLSALRLLKGLLTFTGGVEYILWKIERHSGVRVEVGPSLRRFPPLAIIVIFWRLYRQGAFR